MMSGIQTLSRIRQIRAAKAQKSRSVPRTIPAPTGGWNKRDALADMDQADAVNLTNLFPTPTAVLARSGFTQSSTGFPGQVETVMAYAGSTTNKLFGISGGSVYDATAGGAVGAASLAGLSNSRWQFVNIATPGGNFLEMCNGVDGVYTFDGTTWTNRNAAISGVTAQNLIGINSHKNRLWFIEVGTLKAWYLPVQSITGAANALDLSAFASRGGYLVAMVTWTIDAGYGIDDLAVFITSNGEVIVYRGTDPSSASTWALVGVFWIGSPIGRRCAVKWKGDALIICQDGLMPLSGAIQSSRLNPRVALTDKIQFAVSSAITSYATNFGWQIIPFPMQNMLVLNVPVTTGNSQQQYVMNTISGAWCNFQGWNANCFEIYQDNLYFGGSNFIGKAWNTQSDNGGPIFIDGLQAFSTYGSAGQVKRFTMMRPTILIDSTQTINAGMNIDFDQSAPASAIGTVSFSGATWDSGTWDSSVWTDSLTVSKQWQGCVGVGYYAAPHLQANLNGANMQWVSTDVVMEAGGIL